MISILTDSNPSVTTDGTLSVRYDLKKFKSDLTLEIKNNAIKKLKLKDQLLNDHEHIFYLFDNLLIHYPPILIIIF